MNQWLKRQKNYNPIPVSELQRSLRKSLIVELGMGLLLGRFTLQHENIEENFYRDLTEAGIWLVPASKD
ncbi:MAG: hypothetical protein KME10_27725 [Plectolyngbya sp. WJT66-NPBG17]|jgi:hypothetical protein|nr:hypothetical protein [Plectolyngbya sp. WJT66-NPBG17]